MPETREAERRRITERRGRSAEALALMALMLKGYRPLGLRFRAAGGEIDLIVRRGGTVAFVEVKARGTLESAQGAIDARKIARFSRAARAWIGRHPACDATTFRADAVFVSPRAWPRHVADAFPIC
ncbi:YraN family protein [Methylobacterium sp. J-068]|uniref:YraN family protein n=1 Tax=Methylobacterium sp. J-068 TaxID=2836649 RepID=UPI001FBAB71C|nr:YraN family protein [Methylobacterium sp. J-068]MCJ2034652.1 YraN family protein [Methylobacterium sp. J-068]